ncbi:hypothetical protein ACB098_09G015500 [Castanea mollissima]
MGSVDRVQLRKTPYSPYTHHKNQIITPNYPLQLSLEGPSSDFLLPAHLSSSSHYINRSLDKCFCIHVINITGIIPEAFDTILDNFRILGLNPIFRRMNPTINS